MRKAGQRNEDFCYHPGPPALHILPEMCTSQYQLHKLKKIIFLSFPVKLPRIVADKQDLQLLSFVFFPYKVACYTEDHASRSCWWPEQLNNSLLTVMETDSINVEVQQVCKGEHQSKNAAGSQRQTVRIAPTRMKAQALFAANLSVSRL